MWHGLERGGIFTPETMAPNLGGPSDRTLIKKQCWLYYRKWHSKFSLESRTMKVLSVHIEDDATALKPA